MDPVSHAALGRSLISALTPSRQTPVPRSWVVAAVLGSLSPDVDLVIAPFGWDRYLRAHEVGTHTAIGTLACALLTAVAVGLFAKHERYLPLVRAAWIGSASHVLLDLVSSARVRLAWPFVDTVISVPLVAMADPWLFLLCVTAAVVAMRARLQPSRRRVAVVLGATMTFLLLKGALGLVAFSRYRAARDRAADVVQARVIEADWAQLSRWRIFDRTSSHVRAWTADTGHAEAVFTWPLGAESPAVTQSRSLSTVRNFLRAHALAFAVTRPQADGRSEVLWSDVRFCWDPSTPGARALEPVVSSADGRQRLSCALWFGGELDPQGRALQEIVRIGTFTQSRPPK